MNVRRATIEDLSVLVEFTAQEAVEAEGSAQGLERLEEGVKTALLDPSVAMYWIMVDETGEPVGSISSVKEWSDWNAGYYWWIQSLFIAPEHRGRGLIDRLVRTVQEEMERQGGLELRLYVHQQNKQAIRAYEKLGFEQSQYEIMTRRHEH